MKSWKLEELKSLKKKELYSIAKELKIRGRGKMRKSELLEAIAKTLNLTGELLKEEEEITSYSHLKVVEELRPEKLKREELPKEYPTEFLKVIPVNPKLVLILWNARGKEGEIRIYSGEREIGRFKVDLTWKNYYYKLPESMPFEKLWATLKVEGRELSSNQITLPSDKVLVELPKGILEEFFKFEIGANPTSEFKR